MTATAATTRRARYDALNQEEITMQWRDWRSYLRAHQTLLQARQAESWGAFERADTLEVAAEQAQTDLQAIPPARRAVFDAVREAQRLHAQADREAQQRQQGAVAGRRHPIDPDEVDQAVLAELLAAALGESTEDGRGLVPMDEAAVHESAAWYSVDVAALEAAPTAAVYDVRRMEAQERRSRILAIGGVLIAGTLLMLIWAFWPSAQRNTTSAPNLVPMHNGIALTPWPLSTLILTATNGEGWTLPITATQRTWPAQPTERSAYWRAPGLLPLSLCVPPSTLNQLAEAHIVSGNALPDRIYTLRANPNGPTDLILSPCPDGSTTAVASRYGSLQQAITPPTYAVGQAVRLPDGGGLNVSAMQLVGPGDDPLLPQGQARLIVRVASVLAQDWPTFNPTVLLQNGQTFLPAETVATDGATELRYLIPLPKSALDLIWSVTLPGLAHPLRWRTTLPPPPDRDTVLRERLDVRELSVARVADGMLVARLTLANRGDAPLMLTADDLAFVQSGQRLLVPDVVALHAPLPANTTQTIDLPLPPLTALHPLVVRVGAQQFQIALERR